MGARSRATVQSALLLLGSLVIALALCEGLARLYTHSNSDQIGVSASAADAALLKKYFDLTTVADARRFELPLASHYLPGIAVAEGVDRMWFEQLPAMPKRDLKKVDPNASILQDEYIRRRHFGQQSFYIWNEQFAKTTACDDRDQIFKSLPRPAKVFRPSDQSPFPRYRFPASRTLPSGLNTNRYGFRGQDFPPQRSADTIRIAFIGSSETVGQHLFPFSYPDYFGIWLNRWLAANGYPFHVEIINAGREGIGTTDVAAILKEEVLPLAPDYVIFYDGANQLLNAQSFAISAARVEHFSNEPLQKTQGPFPVSWAKHVLLATVANDAYNLYMSPILDDWRRPKYEFKFPPGVEEANPPLDDPDLPLDLAVFLRDLKVMADETRAAGIPFMMSTITWLDGSELTLGNPYQTRIRAQLKSLFWPLRPPEIRRLIDFSNRTLRKFAKSNGVGLLEITKEYPRDANLFTDGYHMTPEGLKLLAWISLQHFLPRLAKDLHDGKLGKTRPVSVHLPMPDGDDFVPTCHPTPQAIATARALPLATIVIGSEGASLQASTSGIAFRSTPQAWAYIGRTPINAECVVGGGWIAADVSVTRGVAGVGVLNKTGNAFLVQRSATPGDAKQTIFLRIDSFSNAGDFIIRNWADKSVSEGVIRAIGIATESGAAPPACPVDGTAATRAGSGSRSNSIASEIPTDAVEVHDAFDGPQIPGSILQIGGGFPYQVRTPGRPWAFGAQFPVRATKAMGPLWIRVRASVHGGAVGIGMLNQDRSNFLSRISIERPGDNTVILAVPQSEHIGDIVVQTWAEGKPAKVFIDAIDVFEPRSTADSLPSAPPLQISGKPPANAAGKGSSVDRILLRGQP